VKLGTRALVTDVLERFEDGRIDIVVEGQERFRVERMTQGRSFMTAIVEPVEDEGDEGVTEDTAARAAGSFRALAALAEADTGEIDESSPRLAFELAAQVELAPEAKQGLLELRSRAAAPRARRGAARRRARRADRDPPAWRAREAQRFALDLKRLQPGLNQVADVRAHLR
jgi:ATP-dependent Lon protease, bacterial type